MKYSIVITILCLLLSSSFSTIQGKDTTEREDKETTLDIQYIYDITEALSNIIFTVYDENQEIAKGRAYGTKGEHKVHISLTPS